MLSLSCGFWSSVPSAKALCSSSSLYFFHRNLRFPWVLRAFSLSASTRDSVSDQSQQPHVVQRSNYTGVCLEETVEVGSEKSRLDSWISSRISGVSRARVQSTIRSGLVTVNGRIVDKVSHVVRVGDNVTCTIMELRPLRADPEDIPLDIVYEDAHVLVVNKPADMVVHPAPGNASGTLVNGILHHCSLPTVGFPDSKIFSETVDSSDDEFSSYSCAQSSKEEMSATEYAASVRPGIVHRLDKGTSGLLVVAKDEHSHAHLSTQFKLHTIHRVYSSLTSGVPSTLSGRIEIPIGRDSNNRIRMAAIPGAIKSKQARHAASRYRVIEVLAGGGSALVEWSLETGRTHQIRAHAKYLGIPLLGDEVYGGTKSMALSLLRPRTPSSLHSHLLQVVSKLRRPCLHALALGFKHPHTGENMQFSCPPPDDFAEVLNLLRDIGTQKKWLAEVFESARLSQGMVAHRNSGDIDEMVASTISENDIVAAAVSSEEGILRAMCILLTRSDYLASPPLVVAYALAAAVDMDFEMEPTGTVKDGKK